LQRDVAAELARKRVVDLVGRRFGRLVVSKRSSNNGSRVRWMCSCDCGRKRDVFGRSLVSGRTRSCGCYRSEVLRKLKTNPALTDEERELQRGRRVDPRTVEWRRRVYEKDGYECQVCGDSAGGNLVAHHKESWDSNKDLRFDVGNGVTSCEPCHKEFHSIFGYGGNTVEEWAEFLKSKGVDGVRFVRPVKINARMVDLTGMKLGRLMVVRLDIGTKPLRWLCQCDCGVVKSVDGHGLKRGGVRSCGCLRKEQAGEMGRRNKRAA
jgi:5-methylcytosine-specific restriction endonuclease McrA